MLETTEPSSPDEASGLFTDEGGHARCFWCRASPLYRHYHDHEWGFPVTDERRLFEKLCLEGFQAGLSWITILNKRGPSARRWRSARPSRWRTSAPPRWTN